MYHRISTKNIYNPPCVGGGRVGEPGLGVVVAAVYVVHLPGMCVGVTTELWQGGTGTNVSGNNEKDSLSGQVVPIGV